VGICTEVNTAVRLTLQRHLTDGPASCRFRCERNARWFLCCPLATHHRASAIVDGFHGRTMSSNILSCDTVRAGAFFPKRIVMCQRKKWANMQVSMW
jgi:hypothetical protein